MNAADATIIIDTAKSVASAHGVTAVNLGIQGDKVAMILIGADDTTRYVWANFEGVTLGGVGPLAGDLTTGLRGVAADLA